MKNSEENKSDKNDTSIGCLTILFAFYLIPAYLMPGIYIFMKLLDTYLWWQALLISLSWPIFLADTALKYIAAHPQAF